MSYLEELGPEGLGAVLTAGAGSAYFVLLSLPGQGSGEGNC